MIRIEDLLLPSPSWKALGAKPEMDPLTEDHALQEAQLLDIRFDLLRLVVGILFELRMALQLREPNTGILVARGVRELVWTSPHRDTERTAWTVGGSEVDNTGGLFRLTLGLWSAPGAELRLVAESAMFVAGDVPGLSETPPNYTYGEARVRAELPAWTSQLKPSSAVFLDPAPAPPDLERDHITNVEPQVRRKRGWSWRRTRRD